jgi:hypothetical protein
MSSPPGKENPPVKETAQAKVTPLAKEHNQYALYGEARAIKTKEQAEADTAAALEYAKNLYRDMKRHETYKSLGRLDMRNKDIALMLAESCLHEGRVGFAVAAEHHKYGLADLIWKHFQDQRIWAYPFRD